MVVYIHDAEKILSDLLNAAEKYDVKDLKQYCKEFRLISFHHRSVIKNLIVADKKNCFDVKE